MCDAVSCLGCEEGYQLVDSGVCEYTRFRSFYQNQFIFSLLFCVVVVFHLLRYLRKSNVDRFREISCRSLGLTSLVEPVWSVMLFALSVYSITEQRLRREKFGTSVTIAVLLAFDLVFRAVQNRIFQRRTFQRLEKIDLQILVQSLGSKFEYLVTVFWNFKYFARFSRRVESWSKADPKLAEEKVAGQFIAEYLRSLKASLFRDLLLGALVGGILVCLPRPKRWLINPYDFAVFLGLQSALNAVIYWRRGRVFQSQILDIKETLRLKNNELAKKLAESGLREDMDLIRKHNIDVSQYLNLKNSLQSLQLANRIPKSKILRGSDQNPSASGRSN